MMLQNYKITLKKVPTVTLRTEQIFTEIKQLFFDGVESTWKVLLNA